MALYNGSEYLLPQLISISEQQSDFPWELIVSDNGSTDDGLDVVEHARHLFPRLTVVDGSDRPGKQFAQRMGVQASQCPRLVFVDQDDICAPGWLAALVRGLSEWDAVGGGMDLSCLNTPEAVAARPHAGLDPSKLPESMGAGEYAVGGNLAVRREAWSAVDEPLNDLPKSASAGEDRDLCFRLRRAGYTLGYEPHAVVHYRLRGDGRETRAQMRRYGLADAAIVGRHRELGAHGDSFPAAVRKWAFLVPRALKARVERDEGHWARSELAVARGRLEGCFRYRVWCL